MNKTTLAGLRRLLPRRAISYPEALSVAEIQANRLAASHRDSSVQEADLLLLTAISVESDAPTMDSEHSGSSRYDRGRWVIRLDPTEPRTRQRFTFAHEIKHILDATNAEAYARLTDRQIERICDHFAACLLMSKPAVYRLWGRGIRTPEALAAGLRVSLAAITIRLNTMGLPINSGTRERYTCRPRVGLLPPSVPSDTLPSPAPPTTTALLGVIS